MAQVGPLRKCQDIMGPASACLGSSSGLYQAVSCVSGMHCDMPSLWRPASVPVEFYSSFPALLFTSRRGAGIRRFIGSAAALVTLSISLAILNHVSLFTLSLPTRILWTCCMSSWCLRSNSVVCPSSLRRSS
jgi:hypothetical protein